MFCCFIIRHPTVSQYAFIGIVLFVSPGYNFVILFCRSIESDNTKRLERFNINLEKASGGEPFPRVFFSVTVNRRRIPDHYPEMSSTGQLNNGCPVHARADRLCMCVADCGQPSHIRLWGDDWRGYGGVA